MTTTVPGARFSLNALLATDLLNNLEPDRQAQIVFQMMDMTDMVECCEQMGTDCGANAWAIVTHPEVDHPFFAGGCAQLHRRLPIEYDSNLISS